MKRPRLPRCKGTDRKGLRCGRSASRPGESYCHLHRPRITVAAVEDVVGPIADIIQESENTNGPEQQHDQPTGTSTVVPEPPTVSTAAAADAKSVVEVETAATPETPYRLPEHLYKEAGLLRLTKDGPFTHSLGDDVAAQIMDGRIPFEQAKRDHLGAISHLSKWADAYFPKRNSHV